MLKVSIFAYCLLRNMLPIKDNLARCGVITHEVNLCVSGSSVAETTTHLFLYCASFGSLWHMVRTWLRFSLVDPNVLRDHFIQYTYLIDLFYLCLGPSE